MESRRRYWAVKRESGIPRNYTKVHLNDAQFRTRGRRSHWQRARRVPDGRTIWGPRRACVELMPPGMVAEGEGKGS
jgi:hypothetical protein